MNLSPDHLLHSYGYFAVLLGPVVESTGVPFPGETLVILGAAYSADTGNLSLPLVLLMAWLGAVLGDNFGYGIGRSFGRGLLDRWGRFVGLDQRRIHLVERFFVRRGPLAVVIARFISVLRTFGAIIAGAARMRYPVYLAFNLLGGAAWALTYSLLGYELGKAYSRLSGTIGAVAIALGVALAVIVLAGIFLFRRRLERWALGDEDPQAG